MIIDYSKADAGKVELDPKPIVLSEVIESSLDMVGVQATQKGLHLGYPWCRCAILHYGRSCSTAANFTVYVPFSYLLQFF